MQADSCAIILGSHINAYSIVLSLHEIGWQGPIFCVKDKADGWVLVESVPELCRVWRFRMERDIDLIDELAGYIPSGLHPVIFLTSERFHNVIADNLDKGILKDSVVHLGSLSHLQEILDRALFYQYLHKLGFNNIPRTISSEQDPFEEFGKRFFLRMRCSWHDLQKMPRGRVINSKSELGKVENSFLSEGISREEWCYQELLSVSDRDNVSICGWHDPDFRYYMATRKVLQHPPKSGNGVVCEVIPALPGLNDETKAILDSLEYNGPFEMEYIYDRKLKEYKVIELNPRFWMQHQLVNVNANNLLVRRYIGEEVELNEDCQIRFWVNTFRVFMKLSRLNPAGLIYLFRSATLVPTLRKAAVIGCNRLLRHNTGQINGFPVS